MTDAMHRQGINMRYLGHIHKRLSEKWEASVETEKKEEFEFLTRGNFKHLRQIIEREIFIRSAKHVINRILKDVSTQSNS